QLDIFAASQQGRAQLIRALVESGRARATDRDDDRVAPLHWAAINDRLEACTYLIELGADVNAIGGKSVATPLQYAARNGLVKVIDLLVQHGANPCIFDTEGYNCLHSATHSSNYWALLYLLCQP
ncbi:Ankyrin repeat-containing domain protein, partial [Russula decolorans]